MADPRERDLVPLGLPYGERQRTEQALRAAGAPAGTSSLAESPTPTGGAQPPQFQGPPSVDDDVLSRLSPTQGLLSSPQQPEVTVWDEMAASPNPLYRLIARRALSRSQ